MQLDRHTIYMKYNDDRLDPEALRRDLEYGNVYVPGFELVAPEDELDFLTAAIYGFDIHELHVFEMKPGTSAWIVPWAVHWNNSFIFRQLCVHGRYTVSAKRGGTSEARIERGPRGNFVVDLRTCESRDWQFSSAKNYHRSKFGDETFSLPAMVVF